MSRTKRSWALLLAGVLSGAVLIPSSASATHTPQTYKIKNGKGFFRQGVPGFDYRFFPQTLTAHPGDVLNFSSGVVVLPEGQTTLPPDLDSFIADDPDDNGLKFNTNLFFAQLPSEGCGTAEAPCVYDGSTLLYPGEAEGRFYVQIAPSVDDVTIYVSNFFTTMQVTVDHDATQSPEVPADRADQLAQSYEEAAALYRQLLTTHQSHMEGTTKVWDAYAGYQNDKWHFFDFFPAKVRIAKGESVQWHFDNLTEPHTVSMPRQRAMKVAIRQFTAFGEPPLCDPDGDEGTAPDQEGSPEPPFCPEGSEPEIDLNNRFAFTRGDGIFPNELRDFESSGLRGATRPLEPEPFTVKFVKRSKERPYKYICLLHPDMVGKVAVE